MNILAIISLDIVLRFNICDEVHIKLNERL